VNLLVVNAGSSSLKLKLFGPGLAPLAEARSEEIGSGGPATHAAALGLGLAQMGVAVGDLTAAAHRVVHGGAALVAPCRLTEAALAEIEACATLAPLHNPANLTGIRALAALAPNLPQFASFDTAFHATNPEVARRYAVPQAVQAMGIRRYGFHGLSYAALTARMRQAGPLPRRLLALHLGNGASLCAILDGASVATTMGYSPLEGLTMGTRSGSIDGNAVLRLAELHGIAGAARILNKESGLLGLGGSNDMRRTSAFARDHFTYWAVRHAGSMIAAMGGLDAMAFTGGIGENDAAARAAIVQGLAWAGKVPVHVIPAEEEHQIASETLALLG
jgi:acetate kinase